MFTNFVNIYIFYRYCNKLFILKIIFHKYLRKNNDLLQTFIITSLIIYNNLLKTFKNLITLSKTFTNI